MTVDGRARYTLAVITVREHERYWFLSICVLVFFSVYLVKFVSFVYATINW